MSKQGKAWVFGNDINTDVILPGKYLGLEDPQELASHCLEGEDPDFTKKLNSGDFIIAGKNFGCGSSREPATKAIKDVGVGCVVAKSFARIFLRNAISIGLPVMECQEDLDSIAPGDQVEINFQNNTITNLTSGKVLRCKELPPFMQEIINAGGLVQYAKRKLQERK